MATMSRSSRAGCWWRAPLRRQEGWRGKGLRDGGAERFSPLRWRQPDMKKQITLPYGHETKTIEIPEKNLAWVAGPKTAPPLGDLKAAVQAAIRNPIDSPTLAELVARHGKRTLILVDDGTRSTPQALILPILLDEL